MSTAWGSPTSSRLGATTRADNRRGGSEQGDGQMAKDNSFGVVSEPDWGELTNAVDQTRHEVASRYDFRGQDVEVAYDRKQQHIVLDAPAGMVMDSLVTTLEQRCARRGVSLRFLDKQEPERHGMDRARLTIRIKSGIETEVAKKIQQAVRALKLKVDTQIQGDALRVSGKNRDDLQAVIRGLEAQDFGIELAFTNYR